MNKLFPSTRFGTAGITFPVVFQEKEILIPLFFAFIPPVVEEVFACPSLQPVVFAITPMAAADVLPAIATSALGADAEVGVDNIASESSFWRPPGF